MAALAILILTVIVSASVVKVGGVALQMTGVDKHTAQFQALSAFSGTGFATTESERVVNHPQRRRIIRYLMIFGSAGLATVIASTIGVFSGSSTFSDHIIAIASLVVVTAVLYRLTLAERFNRWLDERIAARLQAWSTIAPEDFHQILKLGEDHMVAAVEVGEDNPVAGMTLERASLSQLDILVIAIQRDAELVPTPHRGDRIATGDRLLCYGAKTSIRTLAEGDWQPPPPQDNVSQLLGLDESHVVARIELTEQHPLLGKTLRELNLPGQGVLVLATERDGALHHIPSVDAPLRAGEAIVCYGASSILHTIASSSSRAPLFSGPHQPVPDAP